MSQQTVTRVRRFQRELEAAEDRADTAESNLTLIRAKHRTLSQPVAFLDPKYIWYRRPDPHPKFKLPASRQRINFLFYFRAYYT